MFSMSPTLAGFAAIIMWSLLALFTASSGPVPPLQLLAMTFSIGSLVGLLYWLKNPPSRDLLRQSPKVWLVGIGGLFGYHFFYYTALQNAPAAEASLVAYLWPVLIVVFSAFLPGEKFRWFHAAGTLLGFSGALLLILSRNQVSQVADTATLGYLAAFSCAFIWSAYSVISRTFKNVSTDSVVLFCLATAILSLIAHLILETTYWPESTIQWLAILALGLMPVGLAFYAWDYAMKHGPIQLLASAAYLAPVLSTIILVLAGRAEMRWRLAAATLLVTFGAILASGKLTRGHSLA